MVKKIGNYQIQFDSVTGDQLDYGWHRNLEWRDNFEFEDELTYVSYGRGRSSATFSFKRSNGSEVNVFMSSMNEFIPKIVNGKIRSRFSFVKRGQNYSCCLVGE